MKNKNEKEKDGAAFSAKGAVPSPRVSPEEYNRRVSNRNFRNSPYNEDEYATLTGQAREHWEGEFDASQRPDLNTTKHLQSDEGVITATFTKSGKLLSAVNNDTGEEITDPADLAEIAYYLRNPKFIRGISPAAPAPTAESVVPKKKAVKVKETNVEETVTTTLTHKNYVSETLRKLLSEDLSNGDRVAVISPDSNNGGFVGTGTFRGYTENPDSGWADVEMENGSVIKVLANLLIKS